MRLYKFAAQEGLAVEELLRLPSGVGLRPKDDVTVLMQSRLLHELTRQPAVPGPPVLKPAPLAPGPDAGDEDEVAVFQLAKRLNTFADQIIDVLRDVTGNAHWKPETWLSGELAKRVALEFAQRKKPEANARSAARVRPRANRSKSVLTSMRVQSFKPPASPGERVLEDILRSMPRGLALLGVDLVDYDKTTDVDAIVLMPDLIATVEVKDTTRVGIIDACVNGPWEVDGQPFQGHGVGPTNQAIQQARVLGSARKLPELSSLKRVPATIGVFGGAHFATRPLFAISPDCFSYNLEDTLAALDACAERQRTLVTVGQVQALFSWLQVSSSMCFTREELAAFGFVEYAA